MAILLNKAKIASALVLAVICAICASVIIYRETKISATMAEIYIDDKIEKTITFEKDLTFDVNEVEFTIKNGTISFTHSTCRDNVCENEGYLAKVGQRAVCLPRKCVLVLK